jgi:protein-disulfide isomerase
MKYFKLFASMLALALTISSGLVACGDPTSTTIPPTATATPKAPPTPAPAATATTLAATLTSQFQRIPATPARDTEKMTVGDPKAEITLIKYTDFRCPVCKRIFDQVEPLIQQQYVSTGKIKFTLITYPVIDSIENDSESQLGGQALLCAADQQRAWDYHNLAYNNFVGKTQGKLTAAFLKDMGKALGLNTSDFNSCLDSGKYRQTVIDQTLQAEQIGVSGTPTFATVYKGNLQLLKGNTFEAVKLALDTLLAK